MSLELIGDGACRKGRLMTHILRCISLALVIASSLAKAERPNVVLAAGCTWNACMQRKWKRSPSPPWQRSRRPKSISSIEDVLVASNWSLGESTTRSARFRAVRKGSHAQYAFSAEQTPRCAASAGSMVQESGTTRLSEGLKRQLGADREPVRTFHDKESRRPATG